MQTNRNSTRRSLLVSATALILSIAMLVGTTFAWFTDSVVSGNNQIIAGNLDIDVMYANTPDGTYTSIENVADLFVAPNGATKGLWEPGHTEVAYLKVVNNGTLALKYQFKVDAASEVIGKSVLGNDIKLSEILKFAATDPADAAPAEYTRASAQAAAEASGSNLLGYTTSTKILAPGASQYITLVVYMPETTGNEANYRGNDVPTINFKLTALATQVEAENDSFGDDYDADAIYTDVVVTNETELKNALANINDGAIIGIRGNVTWTTGAGIGSTPFIEAATTYALRATQEVKNITLVGMDETATFTAIGQGVGAIGIDGGTVTFKNLKIVDESDSYAENSWEYGYLEFRGNTVFEDCNIVNAIMMEGDSASFTNCFFNSNDDNQYAVWVSNGDASFENCYITGTRGIKIHEAYGSKVGTVVINENEFVDLTKKPGLAIGNVDADTTVVLTNNKFIGTQAGDQELYSYETDTDVTSFNFTYKGNTFAGYAENNTELNDAIQNYATIVLPEGEYTLPTLSGKEGITIIGAADGSTVIGGENAFTGFGSNFGKNTTIKNVNFSGTTNGVRSSYAQGGTTTFDNCTFAGDSTYGFHIDQSNGATFIFNNCTFSGFNAFAGDLVRVEFNNCTFLNNGNYGHTNIWSVGEFNNCTWGEGATFGTGGGGVIFINGSKQVNKPIS